LRNLTTIVPRNHPNRTGPLDPSSDIYRVRKRADRVPLPALWGRVATLAEPLQRGRYGLDFFEVWMDVEC
jgi:hypothetical protein